jgi:hypothetical protein
LIVFTLLFGTADDSSQGFNHLPCLTLVVLRNAVGGSPWAMGAIKVSRVPEVRVFPELRVEIYPVIGIFGLDEPETKCLQCVLDFIEAPIPHDLNCFVEPSFRTLHFGHGLSPQAPMRPPVRTPLLR